MSDFKEKVKKVVLFDGKDKLKYSLKKGQLNITLPDDSRNEIDTIVEVVLK